APKVKNKVSISDSTYNAVTLGMRLVRYDKSFIDRCQPFYMAKYYRKQPFIKPDHAKIRKMLFICIGGMNKDDIFTGPVLTAKAFSDIIDAKYSDELLQNDMDTIGNIEKLPEVLAAAYEKGLALGKGIVNEREK
ncbi:MAG: NADPH-dependent FMN reductase, partial [Methanocorpusculum sp.]|nr:NADPH-dependent FMN reductase [Methanocorpusculum sp.]